MDVAVFDVGLEHGDVGGSTELYGSVREQYGAARSVFFSGLSRWVPSPRKGEAWAPSFAGGPAPLKVYIGY